MLNPHALDYAEQLEALLAQLAENDRLRDNVLLAREKLVADQQQRANRLLALHQEFMGSDGGMEALFELGLLKIRRYQDESDPGQKNTLLTEARLTLDSFLSLYPDSLFTERVQQNLAGLPDGN